MRFRTEYMAESSDVRLTPELPVLTVGSCFAENIAERMRESLWDVCNPLGTLFNPVSIAEVIGLALRGDESGDEGKMMFRSGGVWHSWLFGTKFSSVSPQALNGEIDNALGQFRKYLGISQALIVTLGTSNCYFLADGSEKVVANCHKMPAATFVRRRFSVAEIAEKWVNLCVALHSRYPALKIIFTVSPVRHLKDGFTENARSKATLMLAVEEICREREYCRYFPAYELLTDDLRDYRFYASDLVHPSAEGVEYIWEKFQETYLDPEGIALLKRGKDLNMRNRHRFLLPDALSSIEFARKTEEMTGEFIKSHPGMLWPDKS